MTFPPPMFPCRLVVRRTSQSRVMQMEYAEWWDDAERRAWDAKPPVAGAVRCGESPDGWLLWEVELRSALDLWELVAREGRVILRPPSEGVRVRGVLQPPNPKDREEAEWTLEVYDDRRE